MKNVLTLGIFGRSRKTGKIAEALKEISDLNLIKFVYIQDERRTSECDIILFLLRSDNLSYNFEDEYSNDIDYYRSLITDTSAHIIYLIDSNDDNYRFIIEQLVPYVMYSMDDLNFETMKLNQKFHFMFSNFDGMLERNTNDRGWMRLLDSIQKPQKIRRLTNERLFNLAHYLLQYTTTTSLLLESRAIFAYLASNSYDPDVKEQSIELLQSNYIQECLEKVQDGNNTKEVETIITEQYPKMKESEEENVNRNIDNIQDNKMTGVLKIRKKIGF